MITYELAKELKEAGFPQTNGLYYVNPKSDPWDETMQSDYETRATPARSTWIKSPTLSELIESCGEEFKGVQKDRYSGVYSKHKWLAKTWGLFNDDYDGDDVSCMEFWQNPPKEIVGGSTPEEAVANLYLAINPKK